MATFLAYGKCSMDSVNRINGERARKGMWSEWTPWQVERRTLRNRIPRT